MKSDQWLSTERYFLWLEPYGPDALRFRSSKSLRIDESLNWNLLPPGDDGAEAIPGEHADVLRNGGISGEVLADGTVKYRDAAGNILLEELWLDKRAGTAPQSRAREYRHISSDVFRTELHFAAQPDESFYGMGQDANGCFNLKGTVIDLFQKNTKCSIPFLVSTRGYGFLWNNPAIGRAELAANRTRWVAEACRQIDYIVIAGDTPAAINRRFTSLVGRAPVLPDWAAGFWQSKLRYETQDELLSVAREYKRRGIPLKMIVIDYFHWTRQGEWKFDERAWPDPAGMVRELEGMGIRVMASVWPTVDPRSENFPEMTERNMTVRSERGLPVFFMILGPQHLIDATNPAAREFVWERCRENYHRHGIRHFWLDEAEPEMRPYDFDNVRYRIGNGLEVSNIYPYCYAQAFHDGLRAAGETEIVNLVRCAWFGSQRLGVVLWSGDIPSTFASLRNQIKAGLNVSLCGIPWWTTDIGGFFGGDPESPAFRELVVRWFQFGAFCPVFRLHGKRLPYDTVDKARNFDSDCPACGANEIWSFGEENYGIIKSLIDMRERLLPYIREQMRKAHDDGTPVMRPLYYDFPADRAVRDIGDAYMFGDSLLVAPVTEEGARGRSVYLPAGAAWKNARTGEEHEGGEWVTVPAPLDTIPLFLRDGASLPLHEDN